MAEMKIVFTELVNALKSKDSNKILTTAEYIYDVAQKEYQTTLNNNFVKSISNLENLVDSLTARVKALEEGGYNPPQVVPITSITLSETMLLFTKGGSTSFEVDAVIEPNNATENPIWSCDSSGFSLEPSDDGLTCKVTLLAGTENGSYELKATSPSDDTIFVTCPIEVSYEEEEPTIEVTLNGATEAEAGSEVVITASFKDNIQPANAQWVVYGDAYIKSQSIESCTIQISESAESDDTIEVGYEYDGAEDTIYHNITVKAKDVVEPTVTLSGTTSAEAGEEVTITASVQNGVGDGYYGWMVSGNATIKDEAEEQCTIIINDNAVEGDKITVSYEINDANGDGISFDHEITVAALVQEPEVVVSIKTVPAGITTAKVGDTITFESTIENPIPDNRGGWSVDGVYMGDVYDETYRYVTLSDDSTTGAKITIGEGAQPGGQFDVVHGREGRYTTTVEARHRITVVEESTEITDLDMGGANTNATSVIDLGNASTNATSVIDLGNANV